MNKDNILTLAAKIENLELVTDLYKPAEYGPSFCMNYEEYNCGAPACLAGWASALALNTNVLDTRLDLVQIGADWLGVPRDWAFTNLFYPSNSGLGPLAIVDGWSESDSLNYDHITPKAAADMLRNLAALEYRPNTRLMASLWENALIKENII